MVAVEVTGSDDIAADSGSTAQMVDVVHTEADTSFDTDWVGTTQADTMVASIQPELAPHSSSSKCQPSFPSRVGMLCNPSLHALVTCKIYKTKLSRYLQLLKV